MLLTQRNLNYLLNEIEKEKFIESPSNIYEFRKLKNGVTLEIHYSSTKVKADGKFDYEALIPSEDLKTFTMTHEK